MQPGVLLRRVAAILIVTGAAAALPASASVIYSNFGTGGAFDGGWSFVPYLFVLVFAVVVLGLLGFAVLRTKKNVMEQP